MNPLVLTCLLCLVVCGALGTQGSEAIFSSELVRATGGPASGEGLLGSASYDEGVEEDVSGGDHENSNLHESNKHERKTGRQDRKGKGRRRNRNRAKSTTPLNPEHTVFTSGYTSPLSTTEDPCTTTHLGFCIHGFCKRIESLREPVCICMKGYDGERCGIQTLEAKKASEAAPRSGAELLQMVLVIVAVVLSVISCTAIMLMTCAQSHKTLMASYLGSAAEQEKLQKPAGDVVV